MGERSFKKLWILKLVVELLLDHEIRKLSLRTIKIKCPDAGCFYNICNFRRDLKRPGTQIKPHPGGNAPLGFYMGVKSLSEFVRKYRV